MSTLEMERRIRGLAIANATGEDRAVEDVIHRTEAARRRFLRRARRATAGLAVLGALAITPVGASIADTAGDLLNGSDQSSEVAISSDVSQGQAYFDGIYQEAIDKARAGDLQADVDPAYVVSVMTEQLNPPADPQAANHLEDQVVELLTQLRAAGDLPSDGSAFDGP